LAIELCFALTHTSIHISELDYEPIKGLRGDLDNYVKLIDGLNGVAWADDRQIKSIYAYFADVNGR
jgi:Holliday junction resolvase RusA-like endonuclease